MQYQLLAFLTGEKNSIDSVGISASREVEWIKKMYLKDKTVATQSLKALVGTTRLDFADYSSSYYDTTHHPFKSFDSLSVAEPSEKVRRMEMEAVELIKELGKLYSYDIEDLKEMYYEERQRKYENTRAKFSEKVKNLLEEPTAYEYALPLLSKEMRCLYSPDKKMRIYFIDYYYETLVGVYAYAHYRHSPNSKVIVTEVDCHSEEKECYPLYAKAILQTHKGNNPLYILVSDINARGMEWRVRILALEGTQNKIINCMDCVEGMPTKMYDKHVRYNASPAFDTLKQELSFSFAQLKNYRVVGLPKGTKRMWSSYETVLQRYILKWNGKTFEEVELKPYCE